MNETLRRPGLCDEPDEEAHSAPQTHWLARLAAPFLKTPSAHDLIMSRIWVLCALLQWAFISLVKDDLPSTPSLRLQYKA